MAGSIECVHAGLPSRRRIRPPLGLVPSARRIDHCPVALASPTTRLDNRRRMPLCWTDLCPPAAERGIAMSRVALLCTVPHAHIATLCAVAASLSWGCSDSGPEIDSPAAESQQPLVTSNPYSQSFTTFESGQVRPLALTA